MIRSMLFTLVAALVLLALAPSPAAATEFAAARPALLPLNLPASPVALATIPAPRPVAGWTFLGCWKSRPWVTTCLDVYRDEAGALYTCKACGTTGNPSKGKCRATTQANLDAGTWCSATE